MEKRSEEKKVRWSISNAMSCVYEAIQNSKLQVKRTKVYDTAIERLGNLYGLSAVQAWILCIACERYLDEDESTSMQELAMEVKVPTMSIVSWKKEIDVLIDKGFCEWDDYSRSFQPVDGFQDSLFENTAFIPDGSREMDEIEFLRLFAEHYECRHGLLSPRMRSRGAKSNGATRLSASLSMFERKHKNLEMVKKVNDEIHNSHSRYLLYAVANDMVGGSDSNLNATLCDLFDTGMRYTVAKDMLEERHELLTKDLVEFTRKGNLSEARVSLTSKGKRLILGEKAELFEDSLDGKNLIRPDSIKTKTLFYSPENEKQIARLKAALEDDSLRDIQARLESDGMPVGVAVLLYGAPGTGKTESVMQIAKETGRHIMHVDISETKSAWFGESEKRVKRIFTGYKRACESCKKLGEKIPILLFNEADAIISKRKDSTVGNVAQTENAMQNIILEELENLRGIFIATTNLVENMDSAFERRFLFKIKFENPSTEAKAAIWTSKLPWLGEEAASEFAAQYDLSGGQIDNIVRKIAMNEIITGTRPKTAEIHEMCRTEKLDSQDASGKRIGFGA